MLLITIAAALALGVASGFAADAPPETLVTTKAHPVAGRSFTGFVLVLPDEAKTYWTTYSADCPATVGGKAIANGAKQYPAGALVPTAIVCTWRIPAGSAKKKLVGRLHIETSRLLEGGEQELNETTRRKQAWKIAKR